MSKRKRASLGKTQAGSEQAEGTSSLGDDSAVKEDMAHVSPDALAGSPSIFASRSSEPPETADSSEAGAEPPATEAPPETAEAPPESAEAPPETVEPVTTYEAPPIAATPMPATASPYVTATPGSQARRGGTAAALGVVLVVVGLFALLVSLFSIDLSTYGWPLFVLIPGLTLLVVGFVGAGPGASIPGGMVTMLGLVLAYQNSTGDWPSWAFAWSLIAPFGVGMGMYLQALRDRDLAALRRGRTLMFVGALIFIIGFVLFESILGISGQEYGPIGKAALPALLILIGIILLVRSIQRSRRA